MSAALVADGLSLSFGQGEQRQQVLNGVALTVPRGATVGIAGPSGSGKSTLVAILAGIQDPDVGEVTWDGVRIGDLAGSARDAWRRRQVGLVFQDFHLIMGMTALANVLLPASFAHTRRRPAIEARARALLSRVGVGHPDRDVSLMSRGEQQRVALARALLFEPPILLADEPTASLDRTNAAAVAELLMETATESGATLIVASHDPAMLSRLGTRYQLTDGHLVAEAAP